MVEKFEPQVMHDPMAGVFHDQALQKVEAEIQPDQQQEGGRYPEQTVQISVPQDFKVIGRQLRQIAPGDACRRVHDNKEVAMAFNDILYSRVGRIHRQETCCLG